MLGSLDLLVCPADLLDIHDPSVFARAKYFGQDRQVLDSPVTVLSGGSHSQGTC